MSRENLVRKSGMLMLLTFASRILGFVREMIGAAFLGTGALSEAYGTAFLIPNLMRRLLAEGSMSAAFVPVFKGYLMREQAEETREFLSAVLTILTLLLVLVVGIGVALTPLLVRLFDVAYADTVILTRIMFPYLALASIAAFLQGILNASDSYGPSGFAPVCFNLCVIAAAFLLSPRTANPAQALAIGVVAGGMLQALFQIPFVVRYRFRFRFISPRRAFRNPGARRVGALIVPTILGMAAYQLNDLVCTAVATGTGDWALAAINYSYRLTELILGIFIISLGTVVLTELTHNAKSGDWKAFNGNLVFSLNAVAFITLPIVFFSLIMRHDIVSVLFERGRFDATSVSQTAGVFLFHITGLYFVAVPRILAPAFFAQEDSKSPTIAGVICFAVNMFAAVVLSRVMGGNGIALAYPISNFVNMVILLILLARKEKSGFGEVIRSCGLYLLKILAISGACALPLYFLKPWFFGLFAALPVRVLSLGIPLGVSAFVYLPVFILVLVFFKDETARQLLDAVRRKLKKKPS